MSILCVSIHVALTETNTEKIISTSRFKIINEGNKCLTLHEIENMYFDVILTYTDIVLNSHGAARYLYRTYLSDELSSKHGYPYVKRNQRHMHWKCNFAFITFYHFF